MSTVSAEVRYGEGSSRTSETQTGWPTVVRQEDHEPASGGAQEGAGDLGQTTTTTEITGTGGDLEGMDGADEQDRDPQSE